LLGTTLDNILADCPYVRPPQALVAAWEGRLAGVCPQGYRRVGIAWAGRPEHGNDRNRSLSLAQLAPLAAHPGVSLVSLQKGAATAEIGSVFWRTPVFNAGPVFKTFYETAAAISCLDLVITVDTAIAHLAGALGKPCWVMLPYAPDWRWLQERLDSPWYPSVRLFRQAASGEWQPVIAEVAKALGDSLPPRAPTMLAAG
jgi:hypothetical protein